MGKVGGSYRYSENVLRDVLKEAKQQGVSRSQLLEAAGSLDKRSDNDRYLGRRELTAALDKLLGRSNDTERLLDADKAAFERDARAANQPGGPRLPQLKALDFRREVALDPSAGQVARDAKLDAVAHEFARQVKGRRGWKVELVGADPKKADVLAGLLPEKYGKTMKNIGEAYCVVKLKVPVLGEFHFALARTRLFNEWNDGGRPHKFVDEEARFIMAFVDDDAKKLLGSSSGLMTWDDWLDEPPPPVADARVADIAADIVGEIERIQELNRRPSRGHG